MLQKLADLEQLIDKNAPKKKLVLTVAQDNNSLGAVIHARNEGIIEPILVGDTEEIYAIARNFNLNLSGIEIIHEQSVQACIRISVQLVRNGDADIIMKGALKTPDLLRGVLNRDFGLRKEKLLNHIAVFEVETYHKLLAITDVAMNIAPNLQDKISIIKNSVDCLHSLGVSMPKIAVLGAIEIVDEKMSATLDAALLSKMNQRDQITGCIIDGPLAFDNAVSAVSARYKKIKSDVAGDCDLLLVPDIEVGNVLYKALVFFAKAKVASTILGAQAPIVLTSRSDSEDSKYYSIMLAAALMTKK